MSNNPEFCLNDPDALSAVLSHLKLSAEVYKDGDYCGTWAVNTGHRSPPPPLALIFRFHFSLQVSERIIGSYKVCFSKALKTKLPCAGNTTINHYFGRGQEIAGI